MKSICRVLLPALLLLAALLSAWLPAAFEPDRPVQANDAIPSGPPESGLLTLPDLPSWLDIAGASVFTPPSGRNNGQVHASAFPRTANHEPGTALRLPENRIGGRNFPGCHFHPADCLPSRTSHWTYSVGPGKYTSGSLVAPSRGAEIALKRPPGVTGAQWQKKLDALNKGAAEGRARVVHKPSRSGVAQKQARSEGKIAPGDDADHGLDLQFGGEDSTAEIISTNPTVNRSVGAQGKQRLRYPDGTPIKNSKKSDRNEHYPFILRSR